MTRCRPAAFSAARLLGEQRTVGGERDVDAEFGEHRDQPVEVAPHQRLAAGQAQLLHAEPDEDARQARDFLEAQDRAVRQETVVRVEHLARHAVHAAEVAAIGDRDAQVAQRAGRAGRAAPCRVYGAGASLRGAPETRIGITLSDMMGLRRQRNGKRG